MKAFGEVVTLVVLALGLLLVGISMYVLMQGVVDLEVAMNLSISACLGFWIVTLMGNSLAMLKKELRT